MNLIDMLLKAVLTAFVFLGVCFVLIMIIVVLRETFTRIKNERRRR